MDRISEQEQACETGFTVAIAPPHPPVHKSAETSAVVFIDTAAVPCPAASLPRWYPYRRGKPLLYGNPEALGWLLSNSGMTVYFLGAGAFVVPGILHLATQQAGCEVEIPEGESHPPECTNTVYGMKPSSIITNLMSVVSIVVALLTPLVGAVIDYTPHRRLVGRVTSVLFVVLVIPQAFLAEETWFAITVLYLILGPVISGQSLIVHAYLPELTNDEYQLNQLTKVFSVVPFICIIVFVFTVLGFTTILGVRDDAVWTANIATLLALPVLSASLFTSWTCLFQTRSPAHELLPNQSLWTAGFQQIWQTSKTIYNDYTVLGWFYVSCAFGDAKAIAPIAITFFADQLQFTPTQNGIAAIVTLLSSIFGALMSAYCTRKTNPICSSVISTVLLMIFTSLGAIILTGPSTSHWAFLIAAGWGVGAGFRLSATRMLASTLVPKGQDAEIMGFFLFACQVMSWLPSLVFTAINEAGISQRVGMATLNIYFFIALVALIMMGNYRDAVILVSGRMRSDTKDTREEEDGDGTPDEEGDMVNAVPASEKMEIMEIIQDHA
jgi:MFS transporter, UMF1 family